MEPVATVHRILAINADTTINVLIKNWSDDCSVIFSPVIMVPVKNRFSVCLAELVLSFGNINLPAEHKKKIKRMEAYYKVYDYDDHLLPRRFFKKHK
jgi:hypothetical protein